MISFCKKLDSFSESCFEPVNWCGHQIEEFGTAVKEPRKFKGLFTRSFKALAAVFLSFPSMLPATLAVSSSLLSRSILLLSLSQRDQSRQSKVHRMLSKGDLEGLKKIISISKNTLSSDEKNILLFEQNYNGENLIERMSGSYEQSKAFLLSVADLPDFKLDPKSKKEIQDIFFIRHYVAASEKNDEEFIRFLDANLERSGDLEKDFQKAFEEKNIGQMLYYLKNPAISFQRKRQWIKNYEIFERGVNGDYFKNDSKIVLSEELLTTNLLTTAEKVKLLIPSRVSIERLPRSLL